MRRVPQLTASILLATAASAAALTVRQASLEEITEAAARVVHGTVVDVRSGHDRRGAPASWVTLSVKRTLKGRRRRMLRWKQLGGTMLMPGDARSMRSLVGLPSYRVGDEVVVFLHAKSKLGFTAPVGVGQGVYRVRNDQGRRFAARDLPTGGPQDLDELLDRVSRLTRPED